jgi:hypothetical protein
MLNTNNQLHRVRRADKGNKCFLWFNHRIVYKKGLGYICRICGKPKGQCHD